MPHADEMPQVKRDKSEVNYLIGRQCATCVYFIRHKMDSSCELVSGHIAPEGVCDLWAHKAQRQSFDYGKSFYETAYAAAKSGIFSSKK